VRHLLPKRIVLQKLLKFIMIKTVFTLSFSLLILLLTIKVNAQNDTLKIMTYNVLNYGDACQGNNYVMRQYLKNIISYTQPDILGLVKMNSLKRFSGDFNGNLQPDFCDSMIQYVLNPAGNISYNYCQYTNDALGSDMNVLFYNKKKLTYIYTKVLTANVTDFDLYKLYYNDINLSTTHDTAFLYVVLFHTQSGSNPSVRNTQLTATYNALKYRFNILPNLIMMGDYNLRNSSEICYNQLVASTDTSFKFFDPPFTLDSALTYPANWSQNSTYNPYYTTSTRVDLVHPNGCGTDGGAKDWYDHILFSPWMIHGSNFMTYIPHSYKTIGNDGNRLGISVNDSVTHGKNVSASNDVINSIFQLSNKYPVMSSLIVKPNTTGISLPDPEKMNVGIDEITFDVNSISINNPTGNILTICFNKIILQKKLCISIYDISGKEFFKTSLLIDSILSHSIDISNLSNGFYFITFHLDGENSSLTKKLIKADK